MSRLLLILTLVNRIDIAVLICEFYGDTVDVNNYISHNVL